MRFALGFTTCLALVAWLYFGGSPDVLRTLGVDLRNFSQADGLDGSISNSSSEEFGVPPPAEAAPSSKPEPSSETPPEVDRSSSTPVDPNDLKEVAPEDASRLLQAESMKLMLDANRALAAKAAELERREREITEREAASALDAAAETAPRPKAQKRRKQKQQEVETPPPAPQPEPPVLVEAPATPVYYQCCGCCNCCSCGSSQQTYVVTRRVGIVGRLFGRR